MIRAIRILGTAALVLTVGGSVGWAQEAGAAREPARGRRPALERQFRQQVEQQLRLRVGLNDEQLRRLREVNARLEPQRATLMREERSARQELRRRMQTDTTDQQRIAALLDALQQVQRRRLELMSAEQREIAAFMTPLQRARYSALQEQLWRRMEELRRGGAPGRPRR